MEVSLNQEALEKAQDETRGNIPPTMLEAAIRTYLASLPPVDAEPVASDLVERLQAKKIYQGIDRNGRAYAESGPDELCQEAAAAIIALQGERDKHLRMRMNLFNDCSEAVRRAEAAEAEVARLKTERDELQEALDLRWKADMRAITEWREVTGRELTLPDHIDLVHFLLMGLDLQVSENQKAEAEVARLTDERDSAWGEIDTYRNMAARKSSEKAEAVAENARLKAELAALTGPDADMRDYHEGVVQELMGENARLKDELAEAHRALGTVEKHHRLAVNALGRSYRSGKGTATSQKHRSDYERHSEIVDEAIRRARSFRDGQKTGEEG